MEVQVSSTKVASRMCELTDGEQGDKEAGWVRSM